MTEQTYNGFKNYETWNVRLWILNDEYLYYLATEIVQHGGTESPYKVFIRCMKNENKLTTDDGVKWDDPKIDTAAVNRMFAELAE